MTDGGRHLAQSGQLAGLFQRLLGHGKRFLHTLTLGDFPLQAGVQCAKLCRLTLEQRHAKGCAARQEIERHCQQNRKSHDLKRQNPVHPLAHRGVGGERRHAPAAERNTGFQPHHALALNVGVGRQRGPVGGGLNGAFDGALRGLPRQRLGLGPSAPARFGCQNDRACAVGHQNRIGNARPGAFEFLQVHLDHDDAQNVATRLHAPRIGKGIAAGFARDHGKDRARGAHRIDEIQCIAVRRSQSVAVSCRHRAPVLVQQHQRRGTDFLDKGNQALRRLRVIRRVQRPDQRRVTRQQLRHNRVLAQL